jgi:predicted nucleotide-binding protein
MSFIEYVNQAGGGTKSMAGRLPQTALLIGREDARQRLRERIDQAATILPGPINSQNDLSEAEERENKWRAYNRELLSRMFTRDKYAHSYGASYLPPARGENNLFYAGKRRRESIKKQAACLETIIEQLELIDEVLTESPMASVTFDQSKVFVVHGQDEGALQAVARFLEKIELKAIVLREQPDQGRAIVEKFEACAREVGFAVVLLTPDDVGGAVSAPEQSARARQNVIFELGYFAGVLGRGRACLLRKGNVEIPSDLFGVIYTDFDHPAEGWKIKLGRELKAAGFQFDADKVLA